MADVKPRVRVPETAAAGEAILIRTTITHPMESGQRRGPDGNLIPRKIVNRFTAEFNGQMVIDVTLEPAISMNPYLEFEAIVPETGDFTFTWYDDDGSVYTATETVTVG